MRITRTHVAMTAIPGLALVAGALIGGPSPSSALEQPRTIALVLANERFRSASDFVDLIPRSNTNTDVVEASEPGGGLVGVWQAGTMRAKIVVADDRAPDTYLVMT